MDQELKQGLELAEAAVERAAASAESKQPRFGNDPQQMFFEVMRWTEDADVVAPEYASNSRKRDKWLSNFWRKEPFLAGAIYQAVTLQKNRGWTLTGGRNQVLRYTTILHGAEGGQGWRHFCSQGALAFYTSDLGFLAEVGRAGTVTPNQPPPPMRALYFLDPTRCYLTGRLDTPLAYGPPSSKIQYWTADDYFRVGSLPAIDEAFAGLGYCAVSRALEMAKLMIALMEHDREKLGAKAPKGLLLLQNVGQQMWKQAMASHKAEMAAEHREVYGGIAVIATVGESAPDAKLIALSELPDGFDQRQFVDMLMYAYALVLGFDPSEFWPVQFGALGRGTESEMQHQKATGKGGLDFILSFQESLQAELPPTLAFNFEQRDTAGELASAALAQAWAEFAKTLYEAGTNQLGGVPLVNQEQVLSLLADAHVIPEEWSLLNDEASSSDTEAERVRRLQRAREDPRLRYAAAIWPDQPIIAYTWRASGIPQVRIVAHSGEELLRREKYPTALPKKECEYPYLHNMHGMCNSRVVCPRTAAPLRLRAKEPTVLAQGELVTITDEDVDRAIAEAARRVPLMGQLLNATAAEE